MTKSGKLCQIATETSVFDLGKLLRLLLLLMTRIRVFLEYVMGFNLKEQGRRFQFIKLLGIKVGKFLKIHKELLDQLMLSTYLDI